MKNKKFIYVKFHEADMFRENGRHIFAILNAFVMADYKVFLSRDVQRKLESIFGQSVVDWPPPARLTLSLPDLKIIDSLPSDTDNGIYIYDREDESLKSHSWHKRLKIKFDLFSPYRFSKPMIMPYALHPMHATPEIGGTLKILRSSNRKIRILFAGDAEGYQRKWIRYPRTKLSRVEVLSTLKERLGKSLRLTDTTQDLNEILASTYTRQCVLVGPQARIEWSQWLNIIAQADFFLSPPGIVMPMCHNLVEAMAVGTIPITNYPEWFTPKLEHLKNCIVFSDEDDLVDKVNMALQLGEDQLAIIRENALRYYDLHLRPENFVKKIEARTENRLNILMYSERNVAKNSAKLNGKSVLIRGENAVGEWAWLTSFFG